MQRFTLGKDCPKTIDQLPKCYNCGEAHTINYRGCEYYLHEKSILMSSTSQKQIQPPSIPVHQVSAQPNTKSKLSYAKTVQNLSSDLKEDKKKN